MEQAAKREPGIARISRLTPASRIDFRRGAGLYELDFLREDEALLEDVRACCALQRRAAQERLAAFRPNEKAKERVSPAALDALLRRGIDRSDITTDVELSDCIVFHAGGLGGSLLDEEVFELRRRVDARIGQHVAGVFRQRRGVETRVSGHFLYPPGSFMGWHTNSEVPGWRLYVNHAEEPGRSFLRYRDPATGAVVTSWDQEWSFRLFRVETQRPFWHAVYSDTCRYSLGYRVQQDPSLPRRALGRARRELQRLVRALGR
jgi:hypothetical protein